MHSLCFFFFFPASDCSRNDNVRSASLFSVRSVSDPAGRLLRETINPEAPSSNVFHSGIFKHLETTCGFELVIAKLIALMTNYLVFRFEISK